MSSDWDDDDEPQPDDDAEAPICPACGVTALPAEDAPGPRTRFVCENPDCESFGESV